MPKSTYELFMMVKKMTEEHAKMRFALGECLAQIGRFETAAGELIAEYSRQYADTAILEQSEVVSYDATDTEYGKLFKGAEDA